MAAFKAVAQLAPVRVAYVQTAAANTAPPGVIFINPTGSGEYFEIVEASYMYDVAGGSGALATVEVIPSGTAIASGAEAITAMDFTATARTPRKGTLGTAAARLVKPGDSVGVITAGTLTGLTGLCVLVTLRPVRVTKQR